MSGRWSTWNAFAYISGGFKYIIHFTVCNFSASSRVLQGERMVFIPLFENVLVAKYSTGAWLQLWLRYTHCAFTLNWEAPSSMPSISFWLLIKILCAWIHHCSILLWKPTRGSSVFFSSTFASNEIWFTKMIKYYLEKLKLRFFDGFIRHFSEKEIGREKKPCGIMSHMWI